MSNGPICLIHGAATTGQVWREMVDAFGPTRVVHVPERASSGSMDAEIEALRLPCAGAIVVGVSGGATLGLELAARGVGFRAAILHEPAVGSLLPGLLDTVSAAWTSGGAPAFGRALYGRRWTEAQLPSDASAVGRDLSMFRAFEPRAPAPGAGPVTLTVGELSPPIRHRSVRLLADAFGYPVLPLSGAGHAAHLEHPRGLAALVLHVEQHLER